MTAYYNNILLLLLFHFSGSKALLLLVNFTETPINHKQNQTNYHFTTYKKKTPCALLLFISDLHLASTNTFL